MNSIEQLEKQLKEVHPSWSNADITAEAVRMYYLKEGEDFSDNILDVSISKVQLDIALLMNDISKDEYDERCAILYSKAKSLNLIL